MFTFNISEHQLLNTFYGYNYSIRLFFDIADRNQLTNMFV